MNQDEFCELVPTFPDGPGVYRYYDAEEALLYVGKAKNLKKRVSSYFMNKPTNNRLRLLVKRINSIEYTLVNSEKDALLLENSLIKNHQPPFNIRLKDDKSYPYIAISNERFSRVDVSRVFSRNEARYFGPFTSFKTMETLMLLIRKVYPLRTCDLNLTAENIKKKKFRACLEFQIGNCKAPCINNISLETYNEYIASIEYILKGDVRLPIQMLKEQMEMAAHKLEFEKAHDYKIRIELLENYQVKSTIVNPSITHVDVCTIAVKETFAVVNYMRVINGSIVLSHNIFLTPQLEETKEEILQIALFELRNKFESDCKEVIVPFDLPFDEQNLKFTVPQIGDKHKLLRLSYKNCLFALNDKFAQNLKKGDNTRTNQILSRMQADLNLKVKPVNIECFDNSNHQGKDPVSACVVFKNGRPSKKDYRIFNVKTVDTPDDFETMREAIFRRYKRVLEEDGQLPDLLLVDGGKGQLSAAIDSLKKLNIQGRFTVIGIAKNLEELFFANDPIPLHLDKQSITLKILQQLRNEAHRFGIKHHRNKRSKNALFSEIQSIKGIGPKTFKTLMTKFKSVENISNLTLEELSLDIGNQKAVIISNYFKTKKGDDY